MTPLKLSGSCAEAEPFVQRNKNLSTGRKLVHADADSTFHDIRRAADQGW